MDKRITVLVCELPLQKSMQPAAVLMSAVQWVLPASQLTGMPEAHWPNWPVNTSQCLWGMVLATMPPRWLPVARVVEPVELTPETVRPVPPLLTLWAHKYRVPAFYVTARHVIPIVDVI